MLINLYSKDCEETDNNIQDVSKKIRQVFFTVEKEKILMLNCMNTMNAIIKMIHGYAPQLHSATQHLECDSCKSPKMATHHLSKQFMFIPVNLNTCTIDNIQDSLRPPKQLSNLQCPDCGCILDLVRTLHKVVIVDVEALKHNPESINLSQIQSRFAYDGKIYELKAVIEYRHKIKHFVAHIIHGEIWETYDDLRNMVGRPLSTMNAMQMFYVETKNATEVVREEECVSSENENTHFKFVVPIPRKKNKKNKNIDVQNDCVSSSAESQSPVQLSSLPEVEISIQNASVSSSALGFEADVSQDMSSTKITPSSSSEDTSSSASYVSHYSSSSEGEHESSFEKDTSFCSRAPGTKKKASRLSYSASEVDSSPLSWTSNVEITPFSPTEKKETTDDGQTAHDVDQCEAQNSPENEHSNAQIVPFSPKEKEHITDDGQTAHPHQSEIQRSPENSPNNALITPLSMKRKFTDDEKITHSPKRFKMEGKFTMKKLDHIFFALHFRLIRILYYE